MFYSFLETLAKVEILYVIKPKRKYRQRHARNPNKDPITINNESFKINPLKGFKRREVHVKREIVKTVRVV